MFLKRVKAGYTLIEMVCTISILIIVSSFGIIAVKSYNGLKNQIEYKYVNNQILNFINNSRHYCKGRKLEGKIFVDASLNRFIFYKGFDKCIDRFYFPDGFKVYPIQNSHGEISIDENGMTSDACTIQYIDLKKGLHTITICVGTGNVEIKE
ncbi:pilus assembly FimT family protein [Clostridium guangxiense]|uniref:pilus assembly FimT family protein n=1 Tax=Clostridium guangxiense TaxID=1662055 RepID=UPI001E56516B|nr:type II secretion system protein [Clostridium guangxiense]MCD2345179.1 type II secretion system GspH family protein [Clostridium guangxiense]